MKTDKKSIKIIVGILTLLILAIIINRFNIFSGYGPNEIKEYILSMGYFAPIIYVFLLASLPLLLFPDSVIVIAGGMVFGLVGGAILTSIGSLLGGSLAFLISRKLGRNAVRKLIKKDLVMFDENNKRGGFFLILILRLIPLFPFKVVSYSAGLSNMRLIDFALATVFGSLPGIIVYTNLGDKTNEIGSAGFYQAIVILIALFVISFILKNVFKKKDRQT